METLGSVKRGFNDVLSLKGAILSLLFYVSYMLLELSYRAWRFSGFESSQYRIIDASPMYILPDGLLLESISGLPGLPIVMTVSAILPVIPTVIGFKWFSGNKLGSLRGFLRDTLVTLLAGIIALSAIFFGSFFFVLPGVYLSIALVFFPVIICAEHGGLNSLRKSWKMSRHNEIRIFGLLLLLSILAIPEILIDFYGLGLTSIFISSFVTVASIASITEAYNQIRGGEDE
jgi:hypothetical protein